MNYPSRLAWPGRIEYNLMPQVCLELKVPKAGKFARPCPFVDITECAAFFNRDRSFARSKVG
jgi:hypothetical protein